MSSWNEKAEQGTPDVTYGSNDWEEESGDDEVTALHDFIAGGLAGSASVIVGHPFDTIKVSLNVASLNVINRP